MPNLIGKTLGGYRIIEQIGLGGMATVFKAFQPSMDRYVALKVLSTHLTQDPIFVKRFRQEAKVIAKLEHLHILPVYDHGEDDDYLYLVMRFIEAGTLKDRLGNGPLSLEETRRIVNQVGSALEYAHQLGVVHRDLKPSNILIDPQGDCYLTDFGIAKMAEGTLGLTGSSVLGTPHYMAPEQSQSLKVDHRVDVYAMGVVIYEMVTGQLPFDAETPFAVVMKHISEPLPLPRSVKPDLPESVERVILKALAKAPADRYQSMRDLVAALDRVVRAVPNEKRVVAATPPVSPPSAMIEAREMEPTASVPPSTPATARWQWVTGQPLWLLVVAGLALVVLVLAGVILSWVPGRVEISGGQVEMVLPTATATPTTEQVGAVSISSPTPRPTATSTSTPTPTNRPSATPPPTATSTPRATSTFTPTPTATPTSVPTATPRPTATPLPTPSDVSFMDDGQGHRWCEPNTVKAGRIVMWRAIGRWLSPEEAQAAVGDSWPPFTANDQPLEVVGLWRSDVEWHTNGPDDASPGWGFSASVETQLAPGVYNLTSLWLHDLKSCTLTVIE